MASEKSAWRESQRNLLVIPYDTPIDIGDRCNICWHCGIENSRLAEIGASTSKSKHEHKRK